MVQWLKLHLPMQEVQVKFLVRELTCLAARKSKYTTEAILQKIQ